MSREVKELKIELKKVLNCHGARIDFISRILIGLLKVKTVNLAEVAKGFPSRVKEESRYRRIQKFFKEYEWEERERAKVIKQMIGKEEKQEIVLDRTEWYYGKHVINILVLAVIYEKVAVPIRWKVKEKKGNSEEEEREELLRKYIDLFGSENINYVVGDREFIGKAWSSYLSEENLSYRMRIKKNTQIIHNNNKIN